MSFETVTRERRASSDVSVNLYISKSNGYFSLTPAIWAAIGKPEGAFIRVGSGPDAGKIMIAPVAEKAKHRDAYTFTKSQHSINAAHKIALKSTISREYDLGSHKLDYTITGGGVIVKMPPKKSLKAVA